MYNRLLIALLLLYSYAGNAYSGKSHLASCHAFNGKLDNLGLQQPPMRVLLVPLLSGEPHSNESPRWSEQPARRLKSFYQNRFNATVTELHDIWGWPDYYRQVEQIQQQSAVFDRVVFISHGGFDGPVLKNTVFSQSFKMVGDRAKLVQLSEAQPGLKNMLSISYDTQKNPVFSDYIATHLAELGELKATDVWRRLKGLEKQLQPMDQACFNSYCSPDQLATSPVQQHEYRRHLCELVCRESLFEQKISVEISPERFFHFSESLTSLTTADGLIFFGACNPGSAAPVKIVEEDETGLLINSPLADGPHNSYVHLVSAATERVTAGPIGESSSEDIVNRIVMFESNRPQQYLCIAAPASR